MLSWASQDVIVGKGTQRRANIVSDLLKVAEIEGYAQARFGIRVKHGLAATSLARVTVEREKEWQRAAYAGISIEVGLFSRTGGYLIFERRRHSHIVAY